MSNIVRKKALPAAAKKRAGQVETVYRSVSQRVVQMEGLPPDVLQRFEEVLPGSAQKLLDNTLAESAHRRELERNAVTAGIDLGKRNMGAVEFQGWRAVYGQTIGFLVCLACIGGAVYLAAANPAEWQVPVALAAIPTAAVIRAFVIAPSRHEDKPPPQNAQG